MGELPVAGRGRPRGHTRLASVPGIAADRFGYSWCVGAICGCQRSLVVARDGWCGTPARGINADLSAGTWCLRVAATHARTARNPWACLSYLGSPQYSHSERAAGGTSYDP